MAQLVQMRPGNEGVEGRESGPRRPACQDVGMGEQSGQRGSSGLLGGVGDSAGTRDMVLHGAGCMFSEPTKSILGCCSSSSTEWWK